MGGGGSEERGCGSGGEVLVSGEEGRTGGILLLTEAMPKSTVHRSVP